MKIIKMSKNQLDKTLNVKVRKVLIKKIFNDLYEVKVIIDYNIEELKPLMDEIKEKRGE